MKLKIQTLLIVVGTSDCLWKDSVLLRVAVDFFNLMDTYERGSNQFRSAREDGEMKVTVWLGYKVLSTTLLESSRLLPAVMVLYNLSSVDI